MNNIIILGCGRSGTSMVAGAIAAGQKYNMGGKTHPSNRFNEKGYFETNVVNKINDDILKSCPDFISTKGLWQGWLGTLSTNTLLYSKKNIDDRINEVVKDQPFLLKDPRFSYTLSVWHRSYLNNIKLICVFRHPSEFLSSLIYHCQNAEYLKKVVVDQEFFEKIWFKTNNFILARYKNLNPLFINYNQVLYGNGLDKISDFIEDKVNKDFPSKRFRNARRGLEIKESTSALYDQLCCLADCPDELK